MVEAAVGSITVVVGVEEVVALPEEAVEFEVDIGCVVLNIDVTVAMNVLPEFTDVKRERDVDVTTANDCEGDDDDDGDEDEAEFVEF